jgi:hypothetical protein
MSVIIQGYQLREIAFGVQVIKTAVAFPQTATANLYTVATGNCLVTSLFGILTTATTTDPEITLGLAPSNGGTAEVAGVASTTALTSKEVGTWLGVLSSSGKAGALVVGTASGSAVWATTPFVVPPGTITITTSASEAGAATWYLTYVPLDTGATVS